MEHNKKLYYIDSIHRPLFQEGERLENNGMAQVSLLDVYDTEGRNGIIVTVPYNQLRLKNGKEISDNNFVYYSSENEKPFENGNKDPRAKELINQSKQLRKDIRDYSQERQIELLSEANLQNASVTSYHINVGHGNCTVLLIQNGNSHTIWMVDCGTAFYVKSTHLDNIDNCFEKIAEKLNIAKNQLHISLFMLTHPHSDHYNGISMLFNQGYCDNKTTFFINLDYAVASPTYISILNKIDTHHCIVNTPMRNVIDSRKLPVPSILFPDKRVFKNHSSAITIPYYFEPKTNNSSAIYLISANGKQMMFPGDMEQQELNNMTKSGNCTPFLNMVDYYCVSHHASLNGHLDCQCLDPHHPHTNCLQCCMCSIDKAIVMGQDGAYNGIYSGKVITDFGKKIVYSEKDSSGQKVKCLILEWKTGNCTYLY